MSSSFSLPNWITYPYLSQYRKNRSRVPHHRLALLVGLKSTVAAVGVGLDEYPAAVHRWSQGLLFHQAVVDGCRAAILLPLGISIYNCQPVQKCSLVETAFLLLVTVSTVNMLTTVLNDSPVFPNDEEDDTDLTAPLLMDSPQVLVGS